MDECGILYNDPRLDINWKIEAALISEKDAKWPTLDAVAPEKLPEVT